MAADRDERTTQGKAPRAASDPSEHATHELPEKEHARVELPTVAPEDYAIDGELARGGIGRILKAYDRAMGRTVALKELLPGSRASESRFVREALVTGRLEHPSIVPVHEAGRWPGGEPFYTMKLVSGRSLLEAIREAKTLAGRMTLLPNVIAVAEAIAYAHSQHVIHRDIKPSNVIVGNFGETVVIDWGLAKDLTAGEVEVGGGSGTAPPLSEETIAGTVMGTPAYMAPEQAKGEAVSERTDVYALGALLYHVLGGATPYSPKNTTSEDTYGSSRAPTADVTPNGSVVEPPRQAIPLEERQPGIPADLLAIVHKAMSTDARDRYGTAKEMAEDLKSFQHGKLVSAHQYSIGALVRRWLVRNRAIAGVAGAASLAVVVVGAIAVGRIVHAREVAEQQRALAEAAEKQAEARNDALILLQAKASLDHDPTASLAWLKTYPLESPHQETARAIAIDARSRGYAKQVLRGHAGGVNSVSMSPDGQLIASASEDKTVRIWRVADGQSRILRHDSAVETVAFSPDGTRVVSGSLDDTVRVWDLASGNGRVLGKADGAVTKVAFSPDGKRVAATGEDGLVRLYDVESGALQTLTGHKAASYGAIFTRDGKQLISCSPDHTIIFWDLSSGAPVRTLENPDQVSDLTLSPDEKTVVSANENTLRVWDLASGKQFELPQTLVINVVFAPDGKHVIGSGADAMVHVWDLDSKKARVLIGHEGSVDSITVSQDGEWIVSGGRDGAVRVWPVHTSDVRVLYGSDGGAMRPVFSPDGRYVAAGGSDKTARVWDLTTGELQVLRGHTDAVVYVAFTPEGNELVTSGDFTVRAWDLKTGEGRVLVTSNNTPIRPRFTPDRKYMVYGLGVDVIESYDRVKGARGCRVTEKNVIYSPVFASDGKIVYAGGDSVYAADPETCTPKKLFQASTAVGAGVVTVSPDGSAYAAGSNDGTVTLWNAATGETKRLVGHEMQVYAVAFSPDGQTLASSSFDQTARLWSVPSGAPVRVLRGHEQAVGLLAFTPDSKLLVSTSLDNTLRIWTAATGAATVLRGHEDMIWGLAMGPKGERVASASKDGTVRVWPVDPTGGVPEDPAKMKAWMESITTARIDAQNHVTTP